MCLVCASPLNHFCGFSNCNLTQSTLENGERTWNVEMAPCECEDCERCSTANVNDAALGDASDRERFFARHRFYLLDKLLGVDDPIEAVWRRPPNTVPVLVLRCIVDRAQRPDAPEHSSHASSLALLDADLRTDADKRRLYNNVLCSFEQTAAFMATRAGIAAFEKLVMDRRHELATRFQLHVPTRIAENYASKMCVNYCAALLRVAFAVTQHDRLLRDVRCNIDGDTLVRDYAHNWKLFADTHLALFVRCDVYNNYSDSWLTAPMKVTMLSLLPPLAKDATREQVYARKKLIDSMLISDAVYFSPLQLSYPHPLRAVSPGEMMSFDGVLPQANIWMQTASETRCETSRTQHTLLRKVVDHKVCTLFIGI